ncbi:MAG TPA: hypothetical protein VJP59_04020 [Gemmatimonadota bacterium]|nr:hypothetical protein [Gemmatimonadota bacterium]
MHELQDPPAPGAIRAEALPFVDRHGFRTAAEAEKVWAALAPTLLASFGTRRARWFANAVGCSDRRVSRPFLMRPGDRLAGFRIVTAQRPAELVLEGEHRFSRYALIFRISQRDGITTVGAETRAAFPSSPGRAYHGLVVGSGAHARTVRRILRGLRERAELARQPRSTRRSRRGSRA